MYIEYLLHKEKQIIIPGILQQLYIQLKIYINYFFIFYLYIFNMYTYIINFKVPLKNGFISLGIP